MSNPMTEPGPPADSSADAGSLRADARGRVSGSRHRGGQFGADVCQPPLSTVTAPVEQARRTPIDLLLNARDVRRPPHIVRPAVLRVRDSTGPAPANKERF
jgi:hypothetical protein